MAVGVFAGIPVRDYASAVTWYEQLFGSPPAFFPNDIEAVWEMAPDRYVYVVEAPERAGGAVSMVWVDDLDAYVTGISGRGLEPVEIETHGTVRKYVYRDRDGNETGVGGDTAESEKSPTA